MERGGVGWGQVVMPRAIGRRLGQINREHRFLIRVEKHQKEAFREKKRASRETRRLINK